MSNYYRHWQDGPDRLRILRWNVAGANDIAKQDLLLAALLELDLDCSVLTETRRTRPTEHAILARDEIKDRYALFTASAGEEAHHYGMAMLLKVK